MPKVKSEKTKSVRAGRAHSANYNPVAASVKRLYNKSAPLLICEALLFGAAACFMLFKPIVTLTMIMLIVGVALVLFGLYRTIAGFVVPRSAGGGWFDVVFGLLTVVLGVLFCVHPTNSVEVAIFTFAILFALRALLALVFSINMIRAKFSFYWFDLIVAVLLLGLSVLMFVYPWLGGTILSAYLAATLLLYAAADVYMYVEILRLKKAVTD